MSKIRFGLKQSEDVSLKYYLGFGVPFNLIDKYNMQIDYALDPGLSDEGISHLFSFTLLSY